jgi:CRISPR-associated protein Cmr3
MSAWRWVFIEASDVWLFRDNKPFTAQENFVARGQFPPTPMTMQGVVRTYFLENQLQKEGRTWDDYRRGAVSSAIKSAIGLPAGNGRDAALGDLHVTGPVVARRNGSGKLERLIRAPLDLVASKRDAGGGSHEPKYDFRLLTPADSHDFYTEPPFDGWRPLTGGGDGFKEAEGWLTESQFRSYLKGDLSDMTRLIKSNDLFQTENRVGLGLDYGRRANREGLFYTAQFTRPCDGVGLLIGVQPESIFESAAGYIGLGGESRTGRFEVVSQVEPLSQNGKGRVKIVLLTPAYFSGGWMPQGEDWSRWVGGGKLVSVAVGKPQLISGWDLAANAPKPLRQYVPAGSVFFFEDADVKDIPFTETPPNAPNYGAMGFGTFAVGSW